MSTPDHHVSNQPRTRSRAVLSSVHLFLQPVSHSASAAALRSLTPSMRYALAPGCAPTLSDAMRRLSRPVVRGVHDVTGA